MSVHIWWHQWGTWTLPHTTFLIFAPYCAARCLCLRYQRTVNPPFKKDIRLSIKVQAAVGFWMGGCLSPPPNSVIWHSDKITSRAGCAELLMHARGLIGGRTRDSNLGPAD